MSMEVRDSECGAVISQNGPTAHTSLRKIKGVEGGSEAEGAKFAEVTAATGVSGTVLASRIGKVSGHNEGVTESWLAEATIGQEFGSSSSFDHFVIPPSSSTNHPNKKNVVVHGWGDPKRSLKQGRPRGNSGRGMPLSNGTGGEFKRGYRAPIFIKTTSRPIQ